jgi:hypothetical protein
MTDMHVYPGLLGATLVSTSSNETRSIVAVWMEESETPGLRPVFVALTVHDGEFLKVNLPSEFWQLQSGWLK